MPSAMTPTPVAIFNSRTEFIDALREALDRERFPTSGVIEIVFGEPYSIDGVLDAVRHALSDGRPSRPGRRRT